MAFDWGMIVNQSRDQDGDERGINNIPENALRYPFVVSDWEERRPKMLKLTLKNRLPFLLSLFEENQPN